MATNAPEVLEWLADQWEAAIPSAECSGIVNDSGDKGKTSKHWSRQDNASGSWAVTHSKDQKGPSNMSAAIDMTMHNQSDMFAVHKRFKNLFNNRATDPRAAYVDCFNGWDGEGSPGRYDLPAGTVSTTDDSHKWHEHVESFYLYMGTDDESWEAARAILSVVKGETAEQWLAGGGGQDMGLPRKGDGPSEEVKEWQYHLDSLGYPFGPGDEYGDYDGIYGDKMENAVNKFRKDVADAAPATRITGWTAHAIHKELAKKYAGKAGAPGAPGTPGKDGEDGVDGKDGTLTGTFLITGGTVEAQAAP